MATAMHLERHKWAENVIARQIDTPIWPLLPCLQILLLFGLPTLRKLFLNQSAEFQLSAADVSSQLCRLIFISDIQFLAKLYREAVRVFIQSWYMKRHKFVGSAGIVVKLIRRSGGWQTKVLSIKELCLSPQKLFCPQLKQKTICCYKDKPFLHLFKTCISDKISFCC